MVALYEADLFDTPREVAEAAPPQKVKKERTPAQIAAFEKAKETRRLKKEAAEHEKKEQEAKAEAEKKALEEKENDELFEAASA